MNQYSITYGVDTGYDLVKDTAIVKADNKDAAIRKLKFYISSIGNDYFIREVFSVEEFVEDIFTNRFKPSKRNKYMK